MVSKKRIVGLIAVAILILYGAITFANPEELKTTLLKANPLYAALAILAYPIGITGYAAGWTVVNRIMGIRLSNINVLRLVYSSVFFNIVTPTAAYGGEAVRAYFGHKKYGMDLGKGISSIVAHRLIASAKNAVITFPIAIYIVLNYDLPILVLAVLFGVITFNLGGWAILIYLGWDLKRAERLIGKFIGLISRIKKVSSEKKDSLIKTLSTYNQGLRSLPTRVDLLVLDMVMMAFVWASYGVCASFAFMALGVEMDMEKYVLVFTMYALVRMLPTGMPEFVGSKEGIMAMFYAMIGFPIAESVGVMLIVRMANQLSFIIIGGFATLTIGFGKGELEEMAKVKV